MTVEPKTANESLSAETVDSIARTLVGARVTAGCLVEYPSAEPANLASAYLVQDRAIDLWQGRIGGWKVGRIPPAVEGQFGSDRLAGPIFADTILFQSGDSVPAMPVFAQGGAAVEAEFVVEIAEDAPADKVEWSRDEADAMIKELRIGLEIASSPLTNINDRGPAVVVSDFGNNLGLIVGPSIPDWRNRDADSLTCATYINDELVGEGGAYGLTGGVTRSVQFILELAAQRGFPLRKGELIATGQTTGIHDVELGQNVSMPFGDGGCDGELKCTIVAAQPK
jgi:2-keto-4-pentenoate hydratase